MGISRTKEGKTDFKRLDLLKMTPVYVDGLSGKTYTLPAYSKTLKYKERLVIWVMPGGKHNLFFSSVTSLTGQEVLNFYRTRFQIGFCYQDAKQYCGLTHS